MTDLESVVISSKTAWSPSSNPKQCFNNCTALSMITPRGIAETNGVVYLPEGCTAIPNNMLQACKDAPIKYVIAPHAVAIPEAAFQYCHNLESVTVSGDIHSIGNLAFQGCSSLTNFVAGDNSFKKLSSFSGGQNFNGCSKFAQKLDFSESTFTSLGTQFMYVANNIP